MLPRNWYHGSPYAEAPVMEEFPTLRGRQAGQLLHYGRHELSHHQRQKRDVGQHGRELLQRTVADLLALDSAAKQLGHKVDKQVATVLLDRPSATDLKPDFEKPGLRRRIDVFTAPAPRDSRSPHPGSCKFPIGQSTRRPGKFRSDFPKKIMGVWEGGSMWLRQSCRLWLPPKTYYCYTVSSTEQLGEICFP